MFDCVMPTRNARNGWLSRATAISKSAMRAVDDPRPLDERCGCHACRQPAWLPILHHLQRLNEILGARLNTIHNLYYYQEIMREMREAIAQGSLPSGARAFTATGQSGPPDLL